MHACVSIAYNSRFLDSDAENSTWGAIQKNIRKDSVPNNPVEKVYKKHGL